MPLDRKCNESVEGDGACNSLESRCHWPYDESEYKQEIRGAEGVQHLVGRPGQVRVVSLSVASRLPTWDRGRLVKLAGLATATTPSTC